MGLWPGEGHFARRYDYGTEYARIMRELWALARPRRRSCVASAAPRSIKPVVNRLTSARIYPDPTAALIVAGPFWSA
jgi:hypothetical protein